MGIALAGLAPHPPLLIPEIGGRDLHRIESTRKAMEEMAREFQKQEIEVILTISPHGPVFSDTLNILNFSSLKGSLASFGAEEVTFSASREDELVRIIHEEARKEGFSLKLLDEQEARKYRIQPVLDHGVMVPLYYLQEEGLDVPLLPVNMGLLEYEELFAFGSLLGRVLEEYPKKVGIIASGDLSHRLTPSAPAGFSPRGKEFDDRVMGILKKGNLKELMELEDSLVEKAGECGLRPLIILAGILEGQGFTPRVLSYEGPFGVGYGVALFHIQEGNLQEDSKPVELARQAVETFLKEGKLLTPDANLPGYLQEPAGSFVSIKTESGELRGCIGTIMATKPSLAEEIISNAIQSATEDPRFSPVRLEELPELKFSVDILHPPREVSSLGELDHERFGVIVEKGARKGVLLPALPGVNSVEEQLTIARMKAGIEAGTGEKIKRFQVDRYSE